MKLFDVALKDVIQSMRSVAFWVYGLGLPLLTAAIFYFAFGGVGSEGGFEIAAVRVQLVNSDQPVSGYGDFSAGSILTEVLTAPEMAELLEVMEANDPEVARTAVDQQDADVAVIIPPGFTAAVLDPEGSMEVELYKDPTLSLGPGIVEGIVRQVVDGFAGAKIAANVAHHQLEGLDAASLGLVAMEYGNWLAELEQGQQAALLDVEPLTAEGQETDLRIQLVATNMMAMMVFFVFFTAAASTLTILHEEESGTLARLFSTPTQLWSILGGKLVAGLVTVTLQVTTLVALTSLVLKINWGSAGDVLLVGVASVIVAGGFGTLVTSLMKDTRQSGLVYGGALTICGMIGMMRVFTATMPNAPQAIDVVSRLVPQGWAVYAWQLLLDGGGTREILLPVAVMLALGAAFFVIGVLKFRNRFA